MHHLVGLGSPWGPTHTRILVFSSPLSPVPPPPEAASIQLIEKHLCPCLLLSSSFPWCHGWCTCPSSISCLFGKNKLHSFSPSSLYLTIDFEQVKKTTTVELNMCVWARVCVQLTYDRFLHVSIFRINYKFSICLCTWIQNSIYLIHTQIQIETTSRIIQTWQCGLSNKCGTIPIGPVSKVASGLSNLAVLSPIL